MKTLCFRCFRYLYLIRTKPKLLLIPQSTTQRRRARQQRSLLSPILSSRFLTAFAIHRLSTFSPFSRPFHTSSPRTVSRLFSQISFHRYLHFLTLQARLSAAWLKSCSEEFFHRSSASICPKRFMRLMSTLIRKPARQRPIRSIRSAISPVSQVKTAPTSSEFLTKSSPAFLLRPQTARRRHR